MKFETWKTKIKNKKIRIALASMFLVAAGAALGAMPFYAHASTVFIPFPIDVASSSTAGVTAWTTYANTGGAIPASATGVILEAYGRMCCVDGAGGDVDGRIKIRKDSTSSEYVLLRGRASSGGDNVAWVNQGVFPVSSTGTFQYAVESPGLDSGWRIKIIGYTTDIVFVAPVLIGSGSGTDAISWTAYNNDGGVIPPSATGVILEAEAAMCCTDGGGDVDAHIVIRKDGTSPQYVLLRGRASGGGDGAAWATQGVFPVSSGGEFQYAIEAPGFDGWLGLDGVTWKIKIVGYTTDRRFIAPTEVASYTPSWYSISGSNEGTALPGWTTYTDPNDIIPSNATAVILQAEGGMDGPDGAIDVDGYILIRKNSSSMNLTLLRGISSSDGDDIAWANQGVFPLSPTGTFDYMVFAPGFHHGWKLKIVGYVASATLPSICPNFGLERTTTYDLQNEAYATGYGVAVDSSNNTYITGDQYAPATASMDMYVIKYDQAGNVVWSAVYDNAGGNESGYGIAVTPNGSAVYVVGSQNEKAFIRKYDSAGSLVTSFGSGGTVVYEYGAQTVARAVALDTAGNVYVAGHRGKASGSGIDAVLLSYNSSGSLLSGFPVIYSATYNSSALGVTVSGSSVYMTGYVQVSSTDTDMFVGKYTTSGALSWSKTYQNTISITIFGTTITLPDENETETGYGVSVDGSGNVFVTGYTSENGGHTFLRKYDSSGALAWGEVRNSAGVPNDMGRGVVVGNSGRIFVTGRQQTNNEDAFLAEYYTDQTTLVTYPDFSKGPLSLCANGKIAFVYERNGSRARVYLTTFPTGSSDTTTWVGFGCTGGDPGHWAEAAGKRMFYDFDWNDVPAEITEFTAIVDTNDSNVGTKDWKGSATFLRSDADKTVMGGECYCSTTWGTPLSPLTMDIHWHSVLKGLTPTTLPYQGDKGGMTEYNEMAHGIAQTNSTVSGHTTTSNDVYVVGYQASNGGSAFLNKYSCNALLGPGGGGGGGGDTVIAAFTPTPISGTDPLTVSVDARASSGTITSYEWDWSYDGVTFDIDGMGMLASNEYTAHGTYTIALRITTVGNVTDIDAQTITVSPNQAPIAGFKVCDMDNSNCVPPAPEPFTGASPLRVNVDGGDGASYDPDELQGGYIASFSWDWGDGTVSGVGEKATHLYSTPKPYTITLTVTDNGGLPSTAVTKSVLVTEQYVCTSGSGSGGVCAGSTPVCGPTETEGVTACYACLEDTSCGTGYQCLGAACNAGDMCLPDAAGNPVACPLDGKCPEAVTCNPLVSATCPDGSTCPASGVCPAVKNICALSGSGVDAQCYVEEQGSCAINADCTESIMGGVCESGSCRYARCSYENSLACTTAADCADSDGICNAGACVYIYDCAYGPGMEGGVTGLYVTSTPDTMPTMPMGVQSDGQACTQPTPDAPNNCEGINGCLYYNYYPTTGTPIPNSSNSVANCVNTFEGGTGCIYYQYYSSLAVATTPATKTNCLPRYAEKSKKSPQAGIPEGCFVVDKGTAGKEYNCTSIDGCYYYLDGSVDCTYTKATATACTTNAQCEAASTVPLMIPVCDTGLCEYKGNGCFYEPNPEGAISCPGATRPATGGDDFVQCTLNPDGLLPGFLDTSGNVLSSCNTNADCPANNICLNGTCYPACQANVDCATGEQCTTTCTTSMDCTAGLICDANVCVLPQCAGATPSGTLWNVTMANLGLTTSTDSNCRYSIDSATAYTAMMPFATTNTTSHSQQLTGLIDGSYAYYVLCQELSSSVLAGMCQIDFTIDTLMCIPGTICPNGAVCPASGVCPSTVPACAGASPTGKLPFGTTSTTIGLATAQDAICSYSLIVTDPYATMAPFTTTGTTSHSTNVTGLFTGANTYYAKCQDAADPTKITNACSIVFGVGDDCTSNLQCFGGFQCVNGTCQPPVCGNALPTGALTPGTPSTTISMTTPADATCRYSINSADLYSAMTSFTTTGTTNHSSFVSGLVTGETRIMCGARMR